MASRRPRAAAQGGPAPDHRPRPLRRRHQPPGPCCGRRGCARPRPTRRSSRSTPRPPRRAPASSPSTPTRTSTCEARPADGVGPAGRRGQHARALAARQGRGQARRRPGRRSSSATTATASSTPPRRSSSSTSRCRWSSTPRRRSRTARRSCTRSSGPTRSTSGRSAAATSRRRFAEADVVIERRIVNHRIAGAPIEPRARARRLPRRTSSRCGRSTPEPALHPPVRLAILLGISEEQRPRHRAGRRRRLRRQAADLRRGDRLRVGVAQARAPGEVDRDAHRAHDGHPPRARPDRLREGRRQARRHDHRPATRRSSPTSAPTRCSSRRSSRRSSAFVMCGVYKTPAVQHRRHRRLDEQVPDRRHPRRRPARGDAPDRGHDRPARARARAWTRSSCGARTSSRTDDFPAETADRRSSTTPATTSGRSTSCSSTSTSTRSAASRRSCAAERHLPRHRLLAPTWRSAASRRRGWSARAAFGLQAGCWESAHRARPRRRGSGDASTPAPRRTARGTRRRSRRSSPTGSASTRPGRRHPRRHRHRARSASAPTARARWPSAARRSRGPPRRSRTRRRRSSPTSSRPRPRTSSCATASSRCAARRTRA